MSKEKNTEKKQKIKRTRKGSISSQMYTLAILPILLFSVAIIIFGTPFLTGLMQDSAKKELRDAAMTTALVMDSTYPGDYRLTGTDSLFLYKGNADITSDYSVVDMIKQSTGLEISLFYKDTRILTTLTDEYGDRVVGSGIASQIYTKVVEEGQEVFYDNTIIFGKQYFTYYIPLVSSHGNVQGIIAAARPTEAVNHVIHMYILVLVIFSILTAALMVLIVLKVSRPMTDATEKIFSFIREAAGGNATATIDESVLSRRDELGEIGENVLNLQRSMRNMMESDPLTGLFNRRSAHRKLTPIINKAKDSTDSFCICIGDIDFFKHVNDTYGHDAGDEVLVKVADTIREHMKSYGFVARWGGEEFLMVFDRMSLLMAENSLWGLLEKIRALEIRYDNYIIKVTMSYGVSEWDKEQSIDSLIKTADDKLYYAKNNGRNRVVSRIEEEESEGSEEDNELEKLLNSISSSASVNYGPSGDDSGHFENLSASELEAILSGKADEEAALNGTDTTGETVFSEDSYTD